MSDADQAAPTATTDRWRGDVHLGVAAWVGASGGQPGEAQQSNEAEQPSEVEQPRDLGPPADPESVARKILLDQLTGQARSRHELAAKLAAKNVPDEVAERLLARFEEVGLIDDEAFARAWVASRQQRRGLAPRALAQELRRKGVADDVVKEALDEIDPADAEAAARALVRKKLRSMSRLDDTTRTRRLVGMLARKGYSSGLAFAVVRSELAATSDEESDEPRP